MLRLVASLVVTISLDPGLVRELNLVLVKKADGLRGRRYSLPNGTGVRGRLPDFGF